METRVRLVGIFYLLTSFAILVRLFFWQVVKGEELSMQAKLQQVLGDEIIALRGDILASDRTWLAASSESWRLYASKPDLTNNTREIANELAPILVSDKEAILDEAMRIEGILAKEGLVWVPLASRLDKTIKENIDALSIDGLEFEVEETRVYPEASSAAHLLGFLGKDEEGENRGYFGLEGFYDFSLSGKSGFRWRESDALGNPLIYGESRELIEKQGVDLLTHIDKSVQLIVEKELRGGIERYGAVSGSVVVMNPTNGAVLALAALPSYDPKTYFEFGDSYFRNPVISDSYEPGSIFKPVVMAAALDAGVVNPETKCDVCFGPLKVDKYIIKTWDDKYHPSATMTEVIKNSDNVGMAFVGQRLGADKLFDYLKKLGFGEVTGIDLQGESSPKLRNRGTWNVVDLSTASFGQGIAVTSIQMLRAISVIANDGIMVRPQVVDKLVQGSWEQDIKPEVGERVISEKAADEITQMMVGAVSQGEAKWTVSKGYMVAGKTGTAQIPVEGHYDEEKTNASFVGFAPVDNPKFVMLVTLREPQSSPWASETAAPLWFQIARGLFRYFDIGPGN